MRNRVLLSLLGILVVGAYAALMAYESLVLDPRAAVPGASLQEIHSHLTESGMNVKADIAAVIRTSVIGVGLAVVAAAVGIWRRVSLPTLAIMFLAVVAAGAVPAFLNGFALGMDVADAYGVGGGAHTIWPGVLYVTSLAALVTLVVLIVRRSLRSRIPGPGSMRLRS